jgi:hypothetical protein
MRQAHHDQQLRRYHDRNVREISFNVSDLVFRRIQKTDSIHKLLLLFWVIIPAILPATMLGYYSISASLMPSEVFHRRFNLLEACFL